MTGGLWRRSEAARRSAVLAARQAEASKLLAIAELRRMNDTAEALAFTMASLELADSTEARLFATGLLWESPPAREVSVGSAYVAPEFSPDGARLAVAGSGAEVKVFDATGGSAPLVLAGHEKDSGYKWALWASGDLLVTEAHAGWNRRSHVWQLPGGEKIATLDLPGPSTFQVTPTMFLSEARMGESGERFLLQARDLPSGEVRELGEVDWASLETGVGPFAPWRSAFLPDASAWIYARGTELLRSEIPFDRGDSPHPPVAVRPWAALFLGRGRRDTDLGSRGR